MKFHVIEVRNLRSLIILVLLLVTVAVRAQLPQTNSPEATDKAKLDSLRRSGIEALYNLDYDKAQKDFKEIIRLYPTHPAGPQLLAARLWIKTLYESRRLQSSLYSSESFYSSGDDKVDPKIISEFRNLTREAKRLAEVRLKQNPKEIEALDWLAAIQGLKASFEEAVERRHFAALKDGDDAVDHHREVLQLDPTFIESDRQTGINKSWIKLENFAMMIDRIIAKFSSLIQLLLMPV